MKTPLLRKRLVVVVAVRAKLDQRRVAASLEQEPVFAKDANGKICRVIFKNVRFVPDFEYTLISVTQIWEEQRIRASFADDKHLILEDGTRIPFDPRFRLCAVTFVSANDMCRDMVDNIVDK